MPQVTPDIEAFARIKVLGVGGGAGSALNRMVEAGVEGVEFIAINTDAQALHHSQASQKLHIGRDTTKGLGAGADPGVGEKAAEESSDDIKKALEGADMVFVMVCAGGGTGSGAGPVVARLAQEAGVLTVGFATKPFSFEGERRKRNAEAAIDRLRAQVDTLITIPNDRLLQMIDRKTPLLEAFTVVDDVLRQGIQGISDLITVHGLINLDFADVKAVMSKAGSALMGIGQASGEDRAVEAAKKAIESPLLEVSIDGARGVLFNVTGGGDMGMHEINEAAEVITSAVDPDANIIFGATLDQKMTDEIKITVIATGFDAAFGGMPRRDEGDTGLSYFGRPDRGDDTDLGEEEAELPEPTEEEVVEQAAETAAHVEEEQSEEPEPERSFVSKEEDTEEGDDLWSFDDDDDEFDVPAFVRKRRGK